MKILEPIRGRVIVRRIERNITCGGLALPTNREQPTVEGEVIAVGPGLRDLNGKYIAPQVEAGDIVLYWSNDPGLIPIDFEGEKFDAITDEQSIITKIKEKEE